MDRTPTRIRAVEDVICSAAGIKIEDIYSPKRDRPISEARQAVWLVANRKMMYSLSQLGRIYNRDHTTILHGVQRLDKTESKNIIFALVQKNCPEALKKPAIGEPKSIVDWRI